LLFFRAGLSAVQLKNVFFADFVDAELSFLDVHTIGGCVLGLGTESVVYKGLSVRVEYDYYNYGGATVFKGVLPGFEEVAFLRRAKVSNNQFVFALLYRFRA